MAQDALDDRIKRARSRSRESPPRRIPNTNTNTTSTFKKFATVGSNKDIEAQYRD